jgi:hypothetical protein
MKEDYLQRMRKIVIIDRYERKSIREGGKELVSRDEKGLV